ncbi:ADP-ribose pyrophosphatase YjhB (NUDIX family) [Kitasatospora gansuensis]|uniref:ADP-ribose pyrophosphatase YjhB (NUDIX family) n=2 Tax=Kitasatospora TaxID=2063 RepID=A0A7W7SBU4_9ACTN|nr:NUDIX hydrolase [Kitasatospora gansuensis]MBB4947604.1 ADP-ribose pyrophosphatase YjhB (NUDIX family) [Kitasatospora gansuensis]
MTAELERRQRVAAYGVCVQDGQVLLARWAAPDGTHAWTVPGGGLDHGEDPYEAVIREVREETGYQVEPERLLGIHSQRLLDPPFARKGSPKDFHGLRIVYAARVVGGSLRNEVGGSTDLAAWFPLGEVAGLVRVSLVDIALELYRSRPEVGRVP